MRAIILFSLVPLATAALAQDQINTPSTDKIEEMVVVGRQPGPPLWKVTSGENELYIFGQLSPLPRDMIWEAPKVEAVIARAQEYLGQPGVSVGVGHNPFKMIKAVRTAMRVTRNPDDRSLEEVLPEDLYRRYSALKEKYAPHNRKMEKYRPMFAGGELFNAVIRQEGLANNQLVIKKLNKLLNRNRQLRKTDTELKLTLSMAEFDAAAESFENVSSQQEINCLATMIDSLETDIAGMRSRANSWARGYVDELRRFDYPDPGNDCMNVFREMELAQDLRQQVQNKWLTAAELALTRNRTTFAILDMYNLLQPDGLLAQLKQKGYSVKEP